MSCAGSRQSSSHPRRHLFAYTIISWVAWADIKHHLEERAGSSLLSSSPPALQEKQYQRTNLHQNWFFTAGWFSHRLLAQSCPLAQPHYPPCQCQGETGGVTGQEWAMQVVEKGLCSIPMLSFDISFSWPWLPLLLEQVPQWFAPTSQPVFPLLFLCQH